MRGNPRRPSLVRWLRVIDGAFGFERIVERPGTNRDRAPFGRKSSVLRAYFFEGKSLRAIGWPLFITAERVRMIRNDALRRLRWHRAYFKRPNPSGWRFRPHPTTLQPAPPGIEPEDLAVMVEHGGCRISCTPRERTVVLAGKAEEIDKMIDRVNMNSCRYARAWVQWFGS